MRRGRNDMTMEETIMIRKATRRDIPAITRIYERIHAREEAGLGTTGWKRGIYPTEETARRALAGDELFVDEREGAVVAAARINRVQEPEYALCHWQYAAPEDKVMVLHTLTVDPEAAGQGVGSGFVAFYEQYARGNGCSCLRMDTNQINAPARALYKRLGYREAGIVPCDFNGLGILQLVCLEKRLGEAEG